VDLTQSLLSRLAYAKAERTIASTRVVLAALSLFAIWFDPSDPARHPSLTYALYYGYVGYALVIAAIVWSGWRVNWLPLATHVADLGIFSAFQFLTTSTPNPIFMYFVFVLFCAALRWGWTGTLRTIPLVVVLLVVMGSSLSRGIIPTEAEMNRLVIRVGYLVMIGALLVYLGRHEANRRDEIQQLGSLQKIIVNTICYYTTKIIVRYI
jgi:hypothetical protein